MTKTKTPKGTSTQPVEGTFAYLDTASLIENPANPREDDLGELTGLVATARARGIIEPLVVTPTDTDGQYMVLCGHRRLAAARKAGLPQLPCLIRADLAGNTAEQLIDELVENDHRSDLTDLQRAKTYAQLEAFGYSPTKLARETGRKRARVNDYLTVGTSTPVMQSAQAHNLTFDQAAALTEFQDDPDTVDALAKVASDATRWGFEHAVEQRRQARRIAAEHARLVAEHTAAGTLIVDEAPADEGDGLDMPRSLTVLADADGNPLTSEGHADCPGHAVYIRHDTFTPRPLHLCSDPQTHGHRHRFPDRIPKASSGNPDEPTRSEVISGNKAWRAAETVRATYIRELLARQSAPKGTLRFVTEEILAAPNCVGDGDDRRLSDLTGVHDPGGWGHNVGPLLAARTADKRLPLALLAQIAADREATLNVQTWRGKAPTAARWFEFLGSTGYTLSEIEQRVVTDTAAASDDPEPGDGDGTDVGTVVEFPPTRHETPDLDEGNAPEPPDAA